MEHVNSVICIRKEIFFFSCYEFIVFCVTIQQEPEPPKIGRLRNSGKNLTKIRQMFMSIIEYRIFTLTVRHIACCKNCRQSQGTVRKSSLTGKWKKPQQISKIPPTTSKGEINITILPLKTVSKTNCFIVVIYPISTINFCLQSAQ